MKKILLSLLVLGFMVSLPVTVSANFVTQNVSPKNIPRNAVRVPILKILVPSSDENRQLTSLDLQLSGLIDHDDISRIWVETSSGQRSFSRSFSTDYRVNLPFRSTVIIPANESIELYVFVNLAATANRSFQIQVKNINFSEINLQKNLSVYQPFQQSNYRRNSYFNTSRYPRRTDTVKKFRLMCKNSRCQRVYK